MKNKLFILFLTLFGFWAVAGTSVGNFSKREQLEFDFRIMYASNWKLAASAGSETIREKWFLGNHSSQVPEYLASTIQVQFLLQFPAKDVKELLAQIQKMHPGEVWLPIQNPEIDGFYSSQKTIAQGKTRNFEYYFSKPGQVVRLENIRSEYANGAAELEVTLTTIRRPSQAPKIISIEMDKRIDEIYRPGDKACYYIYLDSMKSDESLSLNRLDNKGTPNYWSFQSVLWNSKKNRFEVCQNLSVSMPEDGLTIQELSINWGQVSLYCWAKNEMLSCFSNGAEKPWELKVQYPKFLNPKPDRAGPHVIRFEKTKNGHLILQAADPSGVQIAKVTFQFGKGVEKSMVFYGDELTEAGFAKKVPSSLLYPGFNVISSVKLFDRLGNVTVLNAEPGEKNYSVTDNQGRSSNSNIPLVSIFGGGQ